VINPLTNRDEPARAVLRSMAGQEDCDGEPYDQMQEAADHIQRLEECLDMALGWIDAVPSMTILPCMPGFDRDYVNMIRSGTYEGCLDSYEPQGLHKEGKCNKVSPLVAKED
jgi:hypothetical protein